MNNISEEKTTQVRAFMTFDTVNENKLKRILDHHMEYLVDFDSVSDITTGVHGVIAYNPDDKYGIRDKLKIIKEIVADILDTESINEELDNNDAIYNTLRELRKKL